MGFSFNQTSVFEKINLIAQMDHDSSDNMIYLALAQAGSAKSAAVWQIRQFNYTSSVLKNWLWADGDQKFDNIYDDRATLSFS